MELTLYSLTLLLSLIGTAGVILPVLPGTTLILGAMLVHKWVLPEAITSSALIGIGILWVFSILADIGGVLIGTRLTGGTRWGMAGAGVGTLVGMWFSLRALFFGTILGAIIAEKLFAEKSDKAALLAGLGAAAGFVLSTVARLFCAVGMIGIFLLATRAPWLGIN